jgi:hypothetical protein
MNAATLATLRTCNPGDTLIIGFGGKSRAVVVESVDARYVFTTSGQTRPGHLAGGVIRLDDGTFQPTIGQKPRAVEFVERHALLRVQSASKAA